MNLAFECLTDKQKEITNLAYGLDSDRPMSINKICKQLNISRLNCIKLIDTAILSMKENIII